MDLNDYKPLAVRTAKFRGNLGQDLEHAALGIGSELGELSLTVALAWMRMPFDAENLAEELGDASWYPALAAHLMGWEFGELILDPGYASEVAPELAKAVLGRNPVALMLLATAYGGDVISIVKAHAIYGKTLDEVLMKRKLSLLVTTLSLVADIHGFSYTEVVLERNIDKLRQRYPDKYTDDAALARADKAPGE